MKKIENNPLIGPRLIHYVSQVSQVLTTNFFCLIYWYWQSSHTGGSPVFFEQTSSHFWKRWRDWIWWSLCGNLPLSRSCGRNVLSPDICREIWDCCEAPGWAAGRSGRSAWRKWRRSETYSPPCWWSSYTARSKQTPVRYNIWYNLHVLLVPPHSWRGNKSL